MSSFNTDIHEPNLAFSIDEGASEVDGKYVLAKIKGEFFVPDGYSRNKRFYPKSLWEKVLKSSDVKQALKDRTMYGSISHNTPLSDESFRDGKFSHIVTNMYINEEGKGIGEALILNTPTGQILNTVARAGSKLYVSTRADGSYKGETSEGVPIVDDKTYKYHTVDFVLRPGFLKANPELAETLNNIDKDIQENEMSEKLLKSLTEENVSLKADLSSINTTLEEMKKELADATSENATLKEENDRLVKFEESEKEITEKLSTVSERLESYESIDTPENITKALDILESTLDKYLTFGKSNEVESVFSKFQEVTEWLESLGGKEAIDQTITIAETLIKEKEELKVQKEIAELASSLNVSEEKINKVYGKLTVEEIKDLFGEAEKEDDKEGTEKEDDKEDMKDENEYLKEHNEEDADIENTHDGKSRAASLMEGFNRGF